MSIENPSFLVDQNVRNTGIGRILIQAIEHFARLKGIKRLIVNSGNRAQRIAAHQFYQNVGFKITGTVFTKQC